MNLTYGIFSGCRNESKTLCRVGVAVYQVAPYSAKSVQNAGIKRDGMMIALPARSGDKKDATRPCTWKRGITSIVRSADCRE